MKISLEDIFNIPTAVIYYPNRYKSVTSVSIDTRTIKKNSIYVAIKGKSFDGHDYVYEAINKGAKAIVVSNRKLQKFENVQVPIISVRNTTNAYAELGKIWRNKLSAKVISITGSNGKTTTKEILAHLLSSKYKVHKTLANNNNQIGVPLTLLSTPKDTDYIVLEHGTNHFGEIEVTAKVAQPDIALITNIGQSHIEYLESKEKILVEKSNLFNNVKNDGTIFINNDDQLLKKIQMKDVHTVKFGFTGKVDIKGENIKKNKDGKNEIIVNSSLKNLKVEIPLLGDANSKNYLAAVAIALKCGITKRDLIKQTKTLPIVKGRLEKKETKSFTLIDDTYNSNPESVRSALSVLKSFSYDKILVLGDMFELGENASEIHTDLVSDIEKAKVNVVFGIGKNVKKIIDGLNKIKIKKHFSTRSALRNHLSNMDFQDSVILVKGSRGMKMEEFVEVIMEAEK